MLAKTILFIVAFWGMQVISALFFKWGSATEGRWLWGFFAGHSFGVTSIVFLMILYKTMNPNVAMGICMGGAFLLAQIAMAIIFRSGLSPVQYIGIGAITLGIILLSLGKLTAA